LPATDRAERPELLACDALRVNVGLCTFGSCDEWEVLSDKINCCSALAPVRALDAEDKTAPFLVRLFCGSNAASYSNLQV
jgi:hypothetical protein